MYYIRGVDVAIVVVELFTIRASFAIQRPPYREH